MQLLYSKIIYSKIIHSKIYTVIIIYHLVNYFVIATIPKEENFLFMLCILCYFNFHTVEGTKQYRIIKRTKALMFLLKNKILLKSKI
jgi:hypothetical protein